MEEKRIEIMSRLKETDSKLRKLRKKGYIPGVIYGLESSNNLIQLNEKQMNKHLKEHGTSGIFNVEMGNEIFPVKINELQKDLIEHKVIHLDLQKIELDKQVEMTVPIRLYGIAEGVKSGGAVHQPIRTVKVKGLPTLVPESIEIDISDLKIGDNISIKDIHIPDNIDILNTSETIILTIIPPQLEEVTEDEETTLEFEVEDKKSDEN